MTAGARRHPRRTDADQGTWTGVALRLAAVAALVAAWQVGTLLAADPVFWPTAEVIAVRLWEMWIANPTAWVEDGMPSLARLLGGWLAAALAGVAIGTAVGLLPWLSHVLEPVMAFLRSIPPPALLPPFIVLLGIGDGMKVALILFGAVWPVVLNAADGVANVDPTTRDAARAFRLSIADILTRVVLPAAAPRILAGLRVSLSIAVILMVISELYAATDGIGFRLVQAQRGFRTVDVWATVVLLGLIGYALNGLLAVLEARLLRGQRARTGGTR
ncbi:MAG TPA: ABC transporter permease [candidate division Zixibacteria bacterium]|nr:ABC transporter permease [candidate division Zixibacteria bacterium]